MPTYNTSKGGRKKEIKCHLVVIVNENTPLEKAMCQIVQARLARYVCNWFTGEVAD